MKTIQISFVYVSAVFLFCMHPAGGAVTAYPPLTNDASLHLPLVGENALHILSSNMLEVKLITTKTLAAGVGQWDFVSAQGQPRLPWPGEFVVLVNGRPVKVATVAFKRRPL